MSLTKRLKKDLEDGDTKTWNFVLGIVGDKTMFNITRGIDEHPEDYEGPCYCDLCLSYGVCGAQLRYEYKKRTNI